MATVIDMDSSQNENPMLRLMQLVSPALPIGAYSYSQGLEFAVSAGWVDDEPSARDWIFGLLEHSLGNLDVPVLGRLYGGWLERDICKVRYWSEYMLACRESSEIKDEDKQLGQALARILADLDIKEAREWTDNDACLAALFSLAAVKWKIPLKEAAYGYLWSWTENQVLAAVKLIPLGQTDGQRILFGAASFIPPVVERGLSLDENEIGSLMPSVAIGSALHETQYARLFRS